MRENNPVNANEPGRGRAVLKLIFLCIVVFVSAVGGYAWWLTRPVKGVVIAATHDGRGLLIASGRVCVLPRDEIFELPLYLRMPARLHSFPQSWSLISKPGASAAALDIELDMEHAADVPPVTLSGGALAAADLKDTVSIYDRSGRRIANHRTQGYTVRALAASPDGKRLAWSVSGRNRTRLEFRLFTADAALKKVREVSVDELYPVLGPGAMDMGPDGAVYFSGFEAEDHTRRTTYAVAPGSTTPAPVAGHRDWGAAFALSPDGKTAAMPGGRGLSLTHTGTGAVTHIWPGAPAEGTRPAWRRDGRRVAFMLRPRAQVQNGKPGRAPDTREPRVIIADARSRKVVMRSKAVSEFSCGRCEPIWSPGGGHVFFNGLVFEKRRGGMFTWRRTVLAMDANSGRLFFPDDLAALWK